MSFGCHSSFHQRQHSIRKFEFKLEFADEASENWMPRILVPSKSGLHRVACIALYRALLTRCSSLPITSVKRSEVRGWIGRSFRANRHQTSHKLVSEALAIGHEAYDLFGSSLAGSTRSTTLILENLAKLPMKDSSRRPASTKAAANFSLPRKGGLSNVLDRPFEHVSGRRRVPILVSANKIPFLALTKPQPKAITHMIRRKLFQREELSRGLIVLERLDRIAKGEDTWDMLIEKLGVRSLPSGEAGWAVSLDGMGRRIRYLLSQGTRESVERAAQLQLIVEQETELVRAEKDQIRRKRTEEKWQRWLDRKKQELDGSS